MNGNIDETGDRPLARWLDGMPWHADYTHIVELAGWLVDERSYDARQLLAVIEKPHDFDALWDEYAAAKKERADSVR